MRNANERWEAQRDAEEDLPEGEDVVGAGEDEEDGFDEEDEDEDFDEDEEEE